MSTYLSALIPTTSLERWYALRESDYANGEGVTQLVDSSPKNTPLINAGTEPLWVSSAVRARPAVNLTGSDGLSDNTGITPPPSYTLKELWLVTKADGTAFSAEKKLVKGVFTSSSSGTKFKNIVPVGTVYEKNGTTYTVSDMQAPFGSFGLVRLATTTGVSLTETAFENFPGQIAEAMFFSSVVSDSYRSLRLYYNLKFGFFLNHPTTLPLEFPDPTLTGIHWTRFYAQPTGWDGVKVEHKYEDEGVTLSHTTDTPPLRWEISFTGLTPEEADVFDAFNDAARRSRTFTFKDKYGTTHSDVRIVAYSRNHDGHKSWTNSVDFTLAKYY